MVNCVVTGSNSHKPDAVDAVYECVMRSECKVLMSRRSIANEATGVEPGNVVT